MSGFLEEVKRRNVFRVMAAYAVAAWLLLEVSSVVLPIVEAPPWVAKVLLLLLVLGFPVAVLLSWAYEVTREGVKRDDGTAATSPGSARRLDVITIGMVVLAIAIIAADRIWLDNDEPAVATATDSGTNSIAVMPFENLSADAENQYFSDGMTEEIISKLARIEDLAVASGTSVIRFQDSDADIRDIATALGVRYILEGSVRKAGNRVRISAQLIDSTTGFYLWSEDFDGQLEDVFDTQERTALSIAEAMNLQLSPQERQAVERRYINNSEAYDAYLRGQALVLFFSDANKLDAAQAHFERALELEPDYPPALAGMASVDAQTYRNLDPSEERLQRASRLAERALELDPDLVRGHIAVGEILAMRFDYHGATAKFRDAIELEPDNAWAWDLLSWSLAYQQPPELEEAEAAAREAIRLLPQFAFAYYHLGRALLLQDRAEEALEAFERIEEFTDSSTIATIGKTQAYLALGEYDESIKHSEIDLAYRETPIVLVYYSYALAGKGDTDRALESLERALETGYRDFASLESTEYLADLRQDPRYQQLIARYQD